MQFCKKKNKYLFENLSLNLKHAIFMVKLCLNKNKNKNATSINKNNSQMINKNSQYQEIWPYKMSKKYHRIMEGY